MSACTSAGRSLAFSRRELAHILSASCQRVSHVRELSCSLINYSWRFELEYSKEINLYYRRMRQANPLLYNGRILLAKEWTIRQGQFRAKFFETNFASYLFWRKHRPADKTVANCSPAAVVISDDDQVLIAITSGLKRNHPKLCIPGGMPEPRDLQGSHLDLERTLFRELTEELGLIKCQVCVSPGWYIGVGAAWITPLKFMKCSLHSHALSLQIRKHIVRQRNPEVIDIHFRPLSVALRGLAG